MTVNTNSKTGIRFGVIAVNDLNSDVVEDLWYGYGAVDLSYQAAMEELDAEIGWEADRLIETGELQAEDRDWYVDRETDKRRDDIQIDEPTIEGTYEGVQYQISWLGGAPLLFVFESPFKGRFQICSPCVPNAVSLESPSDVGAEGYDVPPDWRIGNGKA